MSDLKADPKEGPEPSSSTPEQALDKTTPPMGLQQKDAEPSDLESLEKTTAEMEDRDYCA